MKKVIFLPVIMLASAAYADGLQTKFEGMISFEAGTKSQVSPYSKQSLISTNNNRIGFNSNVNLGLKTEGNLEHGIISTYGLVIKISPIVDKNLTSKSRSIDKTYIYARNRNGEIQIGSSYTAGNMLRVSPGSLTKGGGGATGNWSDYANTDIARIDDPSKKEFFIMGENLYSDAQGGSLKRKEGKLQITYYTPKYNDLQFGISYIPDMSNHGDGFNIVDKEPLLKSTKNLLSAGVKYDGVIRNDLSMKASLAADYASGRKNGKSGMAIEHRRKLFSYSVGAIVSKGPYGIGYAYGNWNKSLVNKVSPEFTNKPHYHSAALSYDLDDVGFALSGFKSKVNANVLKAYSLSTDYKLMPGMAIYADVAKFEMKSHKIGSSTNKGTTFLMGTKLNF